MKYKIFKNEIVAFLTTGDNIHECIREICTQENVRMGSITGFGGVSYLKVGIWNNEKDGYDFLTKENGHMELTNLTGNISILDKKSSTHIHVTASDNNFTTFGGHLIEGIVQNLMEVYIYPGKGEINRVLHKNWYFMDL